MNFVADDEMPAIFSNVEQVMLGKELDEVLSILRKEQRILRLRLVSMMERYGLLKKLVKSLM